MTRMYAAPENHYNNCNLGGNLLWAIPNLHINICVALERTRLAYSWHDFLSYAFCQVSIVALLLGFQQGVVEDVLRRDEVHGSK